MEKCVLKYDHVSHLLIIANDLIISKYDQMFLKSDVEYVLSFEDYVNSQIHLNIACILFGRDISDYVTALSYLKGDITKRVSFIKVLNYFFTDMRNFLINNKHDCTLTLTLDPAVADIFGLPYEFSSDETLYNSILDLYSEVYEKQNPDALQLIASYEYKDIISLFPNFEFIKTHPKAVGSIMNYKKWERSYND